MLAVDDGILAGPAPPHHPHDRRLGTEFHHRSTVSARSISDLERAIYRTVRKETARLLADALELSADVRMRFEAAAGEADEVSAELCGTRSAERG
ncbi:hypothetical protein ACFXJ8_26870 [Nonomuraea sp. NPDC059194]|uniref:hypothetical protein n=1 Tax=Nonomuraea sp. NPDC059194 TaxID=3346764 RepID=UPI003685C0FE